MRRALRWPRLVFTIEPTLAETAAGIYVADDGWTVKTNDGALAAQFEHTVVVTRGRPLLLTAGRAAPG
jgi:methionyl aminopeptidase